MHVKRLRPNNPIWVAMLAHPVKTMRASGCERIEIDDHDGTCRAVRDWTLVLPDFNWLLEQNTLVPLLGL